MKIVCNREIAEEFFDGDIPDYVIIDEHIHIPLWYRILNTWDDYKYFFVSKIHSFLYKHAGTCTGVEGICFNIGYKQRQNTAYVDDQCNWVHLCDDCAKVNDEYWSEMWDEYNRGRL